MTSIVGKCVSQNGLGLMRLTSPGAIVADEDAFPVLKAALAAGVNLWSGADFYGTPDNNSLHLAARYFAKYPEDADKVVLCIKSGIVDMRTLTIDGSPGRVREWVANANKILGGHKKIDVFGICRVDPKVPIEDTVRAAAELIKAGEISGVQLTEVGEATIRRAAAVADIALVEDEASLFTPEVFQNGVASACHELGIPLVAHTPLAAGLLTGLVRTVSDLPAGHYPRVFPRFQPDNLQKNVVLVDELEKFAKKKDVSLACLALSWLKAQSQTNGMPVVIPVAGARSVDRVESNTQTVDLSPDDLGSIQAILKCNPVHGTRYPEAGMSLVEY